jgi:hypothetical protein
VIVYVPSINSERLPRHALIACISARTGGWLIHREERVSNKEVRCKLGIFGIEALRMRDIGTRISDAMMTLGWTKATGTLVCKHGGDPEGGYRRQMPDGYELDPNPTAQGMDAA